MAALNLGIKYSWITAVLLAIGVANAQYPVRPIMLTVPFPAGGSADITSRILAQKLSESWGHQVVVENKPGAGGNIGTAEVARAAPDGHRLVVGTNGSMAVNPSLYRKLPYDPVRDFQPVALMATFPLVLVVHPSVPAKSLQELIALAKARPGQLYYGSGGNGTQGHLCGELLRLLAQVDIVHVPYKGSTAAITDVMSGNISMVFAGVPAIKQHVDGGRLRALAVAGANRTKAMPGVPTAAEAGIPGFEVTFWLGLFTPAGTPKEIVARIHAGVERAMTLPDVQDRFFRLGAEVLVRSPDQLSALIAREMPMYARIVREAKMRVD